VPAHDRGLLVVGGLARPRPAWSCGGNRCRARPHPARRRPGWCRSWPNRPRPGERQRAHDDDPSAGGVYTFVADGIEHALERARDAAGVKDVTVMGGADTGRQFIEAGLVDELSIHLVPVLFGGGTRMFEHLGDGHVQLENLGSVQTAAATHLRFRVVA
jgi:RibD C-terminal domain